MFHKFTVLGKKLKSRRPSQRFNAKKLAKELTPSD